VFDQEFLPRMFSLGDGLNDREFANKILQPGASYRVFLRAIYNIEVNSFNGDFDPMQLEAAPPSYTSYAF